MRKNDIVKKVIVTFDIKVSFTYEDIFRDCFAYKHYFFISYSGQNSHSRVVVSIFDQFYGNKNIYNFKNTENDYYHNERVM